LLPSKVLACLLITPFDGGKIAANEQTKGLIHGA
jgi:hypothetical protein